jgi:serine/threonine-protein phosphatase 2A regulatory subunit B
MSTDKLNWKLTQVFGEEGAVDNVADEDVISAMAFDFSGNYIALGDKAGRLIAFERSEGTQLNAVVEYQYSNELQSHTKEFDYLKYILLTLDLWTLMTRSITSNG